LLEGLGFSDTAACGEAVRRGAAGHGRAHLWAHAAGDAVETLSGPPSRGYPPGGVSHAHRGRRPLLGDARPAPLLPFAGCPGLAPFLEFVVDSAEVGLEKPDPRIFHAATGRLGLPPEACAYVGDIYEIDVLGAERAGLAAILVGDGPAPEGVRRVPQLSALHP